MSEHQGLPDPQERLRIALDSGDVGTWEWSFATGDVKWTETLERIHGFAPGSFGGRFEVYESYVHPADLPSVMAAVERAVATKAPYEIEYRMFKPDGTLHWVSARGRVFFDQEGTPQKLMGICQDITARRRATDALRLLSDASSALASSLDYEKTLATVARLTVPRLADWCVVDVLHDDGTLRRVALAHHDESKEALALDLENRYPTPLDAPNGPSNVIRTGVIEFVPDIPLEMLRANAHDEEHLQLIRSLGMRSYICLPLLARGRTLGAITIINGEGRGAHDAQDLRLAEEVAGRAALAIDNARLYHKSVEASRAKDEFLATLSHELKSPITAVLGFASLLEAGGLDDEEFRAAVESIKSSARAQAKLVEDILEVSREVMGKVRLDVSPMDISGAVRLAADSIAPAARAKGVSVRIEGTGDPCLVLADPNRIQQVMWNLTSNALKFTPAGGAIMMKIARDETSAVIEVRDTGAGISPAFLPFVFERFRQGGEARDIGGLGLGLAIVRHLVELHAGSVEARSEGEGKGAAFVVRLPLLADHIQETPAEGRSVQAH